MNNATRSSPSRAQRRSARLPLRVRLQVRPANDPQFDADTVMISRYGAKVRIGPFHRKLTTGEQIRLCQRGSYTWRTARIVWTDRVSDSYFGIELETPENFWGVSFPEQCAADDFASSRTYTPLAARTAASIEALPPINPSTGS